MKTSFYSTEELLTIGLKKYGKNVLISRNAQIYNPEKIIVGDNVRVDDYCILSGKMKLGNYIHISAYTGVFAGNIGVEIEDFVTISSRCMLYAISDDYSGEYLTNPMIDEKYRGVNEKKIIIKKHSIVGTGSTILPGVIIKTGVAVGSMSLVKEDLEAWGIYAGVPCKYIGARKKELLELEKEFLANKGIG